MTNKKRDTSIDALRGLAIFIMVGANMAPILAAPHPLLFRLTCSLAAPTFITLAGAMVGLAVLKAPQTHGLAFFAKRGLFLLLVAGLIDVVANNTVPFLNVDVLYLIGISMPLWLLATRLSSRILFFLTLFSYLATFALQRALGYVGEVPFVPMSHPGLLLSHHWTVYAKQWLIDGWFPLFPWAANGLVGILLARYRWGSPGQVNSFAKLGPLCLGLALGCCGCLYFWLYPGPTYERMGYVELFYPARAGFLMIAASFLLLCLSLIDATRTFPVLDWLRPYGEASLFMYAIHLIIINRIIENISENLSLPSYLLALTLTLLFMNYCGRLLRKIRSRFPEMPTGVKWFVGS